MLLHLTLESCLYGRSIICMISTTELIGNLSRELCRQRTKSTVFGQMILVYHDPFVMSTRHGLHINQVHLSTSVITRYVGILDSQNIKQTDVHASKFL